MVLQADDRQFGLVVDEINDTEEIVVKPLGKHSKTSPVFAGATIMGDGKVALILDVLGLAQLASLAGESREHATARRQRRIGRECRSSVNRGCSFGLGIGKTAVPSRWSRGWRSLSRTGEMSGNRQVVQYRGEIMPLVRVADACRLGPELARGLHASSCAYRRRP